MRFQLLGMPVEVQGTFWMTALLFAIWQRTPSLIASSVVVMFVAVLVHELGHALVARGFGAKPRIVLHGFGGATHFEGARLSRWQSVVTTLSGPGAGFLLGVLVLVGSRAAGVQGGWGYEIVKQMLWCTFGWGILNLVPVLPLDGGLVMRDALGPSRGRLVLVLSMLFGAILTVFFLKTGLIFAGILFALATYQSGRGAMSYGDYEAEMAARGELARQRLAAAQRSLDAGYLADATLRAGEAMMLATEPSVRDGARRVAAAAAVAEGDGKRALEILVHLEVPADDDVVLRAQALDVAGSREEGFALLRSKVERDPSGPALLPLLRGLVATEQVSEALALAGAFEQRGSVEALAWLAGALRDQGQPERGAQLFEALHRRTGEARFEQEALRARAATAEG